MTVRVHVTCGFLDEATQLELASATEALGFDGVTLPDHVALPVTPDGQYPYSADGRPPFAPGTPSPDPLVVAGAIGARTTTLTVLTSVLVLPMRHPLLVAKAAATTARLAGGRFVLGVGAGWQRAEFEALGADFGRRGARMDAATCFGRRGRRMSSSMAVRCTRSARCA